MSDPFGTDAATPLRCTMAALEPRFARLWRRCVLPGQDAVHAPAWLELVDNYDGPGRRYHAAGHLVFCLREFDMAAALAARPDAVEMAIWFHDVVILAGARDNEQRSSLLFAEHAAGLFSPDFIEAVSALILATTHQQPELPPDARLLCDIDLASLGIDWPGFVADCRALRAESDAPADAYIAGKLRFFAALLARPRIYLTAYFKARYEVSARVNVARFMAMLERSAFP